jgi:hypothetical protein
MTISSTRDNTFPIMVFLVRIGHSGMNADRARKANIWQQPVEKLDIVGIRRIADAQATVASCDEGGPT